MTERISSLPLYGAYPGVELSAELLDVFSHPECGLGIVHIAGTNGKGTTAAYTAAMLRAAGCHVGLYTSPHLKDIRERIAVDGQIIDEAAFCRITEEVLSARVKKQPAMSDVLFVAALLFFREKGCDHAVIETGLGGRLDSTAAMKQVPGVTAIPKIGLDHTAVLGTTIEAIAAEKAGIIKPGTTVVLGRMDSAAEVVIRKRAEELYVPVIRAKEIAMPSEGEGEIPSQQKEASVPGTAFTELLLPVDSDPERKAGTLPLFLLQKSYLYENICTAAAVTKQLIKPEAKWREAVTASVRTVKTPGRLDVMSKEPFLLFDGAHNPQGAKALADTLRAWFPGERFLFLIGCFKRPDYEGLLASFGAMAACVYPVDILHERNLGAKVIAEYYKGQGVPVDYVNEGALPDRPKELREALRAAKARAKATSEKIIVCGSLHLYAPLAKASQQENE